MAGLPERPHPLAPYAGQITPDAVYTLRGIASLMGMSLTSATNLNTHGLLPGGRIRVGDRGRKLHVWTGARLLRLASRPVRLELDHTRYAPTTLYRVGCRCAVCASAHTAETVARSRALSEQALPAPARARLLKLVEEGATVPEAAAAVGVTHQQVYGRAGWDAEFGEALDEAGWFLCTLTPDHPSCGTASRWRRGGCRGTGCREWRRDTSRREREVPT